MNLAEIIHNIQQTKNTFKQNALAAVNTHLTIRNWLIGMYIVEFEQNGEDRARYGQKILQVLAEKLADDNMSVSNLKVYRQFYLVYPQLTEIIPQFLHKHFDFKGQSAIGYFKLIEKKHIRIGQSPNVQFQQPDNLSIATKVA